MWLNGPRSPLYSVVMYSLAEVLISLSLIFTMNLSSLDSLGQTILTLRGSDEASIQRRPPNPFPVMLLNHR